MVAKVNSCATSKQSRNHAITQLKKIAEGVGQVFFKCRESNGTRKEERLPEKMADGWKSDERDNVFRINDEKDCEMNFSALHGL